MVKLHLNKILTEKVIQLLSLSPTNVEAKEINQILEKTDFWEQIVRESRNNLIEAEINQLLSNEILQQKLLNLLSNLTGIHRSDIQRYATSDVNLNKDVENFKKIASTLNVKIIEIIEPLVKKEAVKLKIAQEAEKKGISLKQLSERSQVDLNVICFYVTQPIEEKKLNEAAFQSNLSAISKVLECKIEDLKDSDLVYLPPTKLRIKELLDEKNLTLEEFSLLTGISLEIVDLIANNPVDMNALVFDLKEEKWNREAVRLCKLFCPFLGCKCSR